jgi:tetratricopeptide (TPR) repeat protein
MKVRVILAGLALILAGCGPSKKQIQDQAMKAKAEKDARTAFNQGVRMLVGRGANYHEALAHFEKAAGLDPSLYQAHFNLGLLLARGNDFERSEAAYKKALQIRPRDRAASFNLADLYQQQGEFDEAISVLERFIDRDPTDHTARNNLAVLFRLKGDFDKASFHARYVLDHDPKQVLAYNILATIFSEQGRHEMAQDLFRRALMLDEDNPLVLNNQGLARLRQQRVQEALELFLKSFEKDRKLVEAGLNAASVYMDSGDYVRASRIYRRVVQHNPGVLPALVGSAVALRGQGKFNQAEKSYQQILGLDQKHAQTLFNLGLLYMNHREKPAWACEAFQRFLKSGRASEAEIKRARGYLEDIRLSNPDACKP